MIHLMKTLAVVLMLGVLGAGSGCSTFHRDARRFKALPAVEQAGQGVEGLWVGRWQDGRRPDHGGELKWVLTRSGDQIHHLSSHSRWWRWFSSALDATVVVTPLGPGRHEIRGGRGIWPFGTYTFSGMADGDQLRAVYEVSGRPGTMELRRVRPGDGG